MAKRKPRSPQRDVASTYRSKLSARKTAVLAREAARWNPSPRDRLDLIFAALLHTTTKPGTKVGGVRKGLLEHYVFPAAVRHNPERKALFRSSRMVVQAAKEKNMLSFREARRELKGLWLEVRSKRP